MLKAMSKFQGVLKMFMLGMLKTILKTMLKYEKKTITFYGTCWNWAADFIFLVRFYTRKRCETYAKFAFIKICYVWMIGCVQNPLEMYAYWILVGSLQQVMQKAIFLSTLRFIVLQVLADVNRFNHYKSREKY